eukprot:gene5261-7310_t
MYVMNKLLQCLILEFLVIHSILIVLGIDLIDYTFPNEKKTEFHLDSSDMIKFSHRRLQNGKTWNYDDVAKLHHWEKYNRTAVIMTGQLRSSNITWTSGQILQNINSRMFGPDDPPTTALTIIEWLLKPIARTHGVDVFMYLTANPLFENTPWDGSAFNYEPKLNDFNGCKVFSDNPFFQGTGNKFFCQIEPESELMTPFLLNFTMWKTCSHVAMKEQVLQQLYGLYRANLGVKQYMLASGTEYKYKIRMRPDIALVKEFPPLTSFDFSPPHGAPCRSMIYYANKHIYKSGNEDWFDIGLTEDMDHLLDRYVDFVSTPFLSSSHKAWWDLEDHLTGLMHSRYGVCMGPKDDIWMVVIRKIQHQTINKWHLEPNKNQWKELST